MTPDLAVTVRQRQTESPSLQVVTSPAEDHLHLSQMVVVDFSLSESSQDDKNPSYEQECDVFESCTGLNLALDFQNTSLSSSNPFS